MAVFVPDPWEPGHGGYYPDTVHVTDPQLRRPVLGPDGQPVPRPLPQSHPFGFNLSPKRDRS